MIATYHRIKQQRAAGGIDGGFTLIELLIVIVVLGILAAVVVFSLGGVTSSSAKAACKADVATIQTAVAAYEAQNANAIPTQALLVPSYVTSWPSNPPHYSIAVDSAGLVQVTAPVGGATVAGLLGCDTAS